MDRAYDAVFFDLFGTLVDDRGDALEGAREATSALVRGRWAIVTSCPLQLARALVTRAALPEPPFIVSSEDVARGKPAPDCYELAARRAGVRSERCLVIEDSAHGVQAGIAAGMQVIAVRRGRRVDFPSSVRVVDSLRAVVLEEDEYGAILVL